MSQCVTIFFLFCFISQWNRWIRWCQLFSYSMDKNKAKNVKQKVVENKNSVLRIYLFIYFFLFKLCLFVACKKIHNTMTLLLWMNCLASHYNVMTTFDDDNGNVFFLSLPINSVWFKLLYNNYLYNKKKLNVILTRKKILAISMFLFCISFNSEFINDG